MRKAFTVGIAFLCVGVCLADEFAGKCVGVTDGDTITVLHNAVETRIRLQGIDCPEGGEPFSAKAKKFTSAFVFGKEVTVRTAGRDRYGRTVGTVLVDGKDLALALVQAGLAKHTPRYSSDQKLAEAERIAKAAELGIWSLPPPPSEVEPAVGSEKLVVYHGNRRSRVFHAPWCRYYNCKNCTVVFRSREEAARAGYKPGGHCNP